MGEALISKGGSSEFKGLVKITGNVGDTIQCIGSSKTITRSITSSTGATIKIPLDFGSWTINKIVNGATKKSVEIYIDSSKEYNVDMSVYVYGISIDMSNTNPAGAVTYTDNAVGFTPLSVNKSTGVCNYGSWESIITDFIGCRPCIHTGGERTEYLNPNDYNKYVDGTMRPANPIEGNTMVEFKKLWYKYSINGNTLTFKISNTNADGSYVQSAFKSMDGSGTVKDYMYYGAYEAHVISSAAYSLCSATPTVSISYTNFRTYCQANGSVYGMEDWVKRCYILGLLMLVTKTRGIQEAIGNGICDSNTAIATGTMDTKGLFYGGGSNVGVKCFGIENMWGNYLNWCDGIRTLSSSTTGFKDGAPYSDSGSTGYTSVAVTTSYGCPTSYSTILDGAAIFHSAVQSDYTIGWCDLARVYSDSGRVACVGGGYGDNLGSAGPFYVYVYIAPSSSYSDFGARLIAC